MAEGPDPLVALAVAAIDAANADDPVRLEVEGRSRPKEVVHAERMTHWVKTLDPDADTAQLIAARAHHLRRWTVARDSYPEGRAGYLQWRVAQRKRQARELREILASVDSPAEVTARAVDIVTKKGRVGDASVQTHEDALCLVFLELQFDDLLARLDHDRMVQVLRKSIAKMSRQGIEAAAALPLTAPQRALLDEALRSPSTG